MKSLLLIALLVPGIALAGRPLSTEDASTLDDKACQLESWVDRTNANTTAWFVAPACTYFDVEWQLGGARAREDGASFLAYSYFQGKYAFKPIEEGAWGIGIVAGLNRYPKREAKADWGDPFAIIPVSFGLGEDKETRALVHLNVGTTRLRDEARNLTLWGAAIEKPVTGSLTLLAETFGENGGKPFFRAGGRYTLLEGLDVDFTVVTRSGGEKADRLWSLGFHWESKPFLP